MSSAVRAPSDFGLPTRCIFHTVTGESREQSRTVTDRPDIRYILLMGQIHAGKTALFSPGSFLMIYNHKNIKILLSAKLFPNYFFHHHKNCMPTGCFQYKSAKPFE